LNGFHVNAFGPKAWAGLEFATQPVCWLELSIGGAYFSWRQNKVFENNVSRIEAANYRAFSLRLLSRFWILEKHSPVVDAGLGIGFYKSFAADARTLRTDGQEVTWAPFDVSWTPFVANVGAGYGFRMPDGPFRIALVGGGVFHVPLGLKPESRPGAEYPSTQFDAQLVGLARESPKRAGIYGEISFGFLF
jgi:hypothetical protein